MDDPLRESRRAIFRERGESDPTMIPLRQDNEEVAAIYMLTRGQVITSTMGKVVDLSIPAVKIMMDLYGVTQQRECLERVLRLFYHMTASYQDAHGETH